MSGRRHREGRHGGSGGEPGGAGGRGASLRSDPPPNPVSQPCSAVSSSFCLLCGSREMAFADLPLKSHPRRINDGLPPMGAVPKNRRSSSHPRRRSAFLRGSRATGALPPPTLILQSGGDNGPEGFSRSIGGHDISCRDVCGGAFVGGGGGMITFRRD